MCWGDRCISLRSGCCGALARLGKSALRWRRLQQGPGVAQHCTTCTPLRSSSFLFQQQQPPCTATPTAHVAAAPAAHTAAATSPTSLCSPPAAGQLTGGGSIPSHLISLQAAGQDPGIVLALAPLHAQRTTAAAPAADHHAAAEQGSFVFVPVRARPVPGASLSGVALARPCQMSGRLKYGGEGCWPASGLVWGTAALCRMVSISIPRGVPGKRGYGIQV